MNKEKNITKLRDNEALSKFSETELKEYLMQFDWNWPEFEPKHISPAIRKFSDDFFESLEKFAHIKREKRYLYELLENTNGQYIIDEDTAYKVTSAKIVEGLHFLCNEESDIGMYLESRAHETPKNANAFKTYFHDWVNLENNLACSPIILGDRRKTSLKNGNYRFTLINYYNIEIDRTKAFKEIHLWKGSERNYHLIDKELVDKVDKLQTQIDKKAGIRRDDRNHII